MRTAFARILPGASALCLAACLGSDPAGPTGPSTPEGVFRSIGTYTISGKNLLLNPDQDTLRHCDGDSLVTQVKAGLDTLAMELKGDSLILVNDTDRPDSSISVFVDILIRTGSGTGVEGSWKLGPSYWRTISGVISQQQRDQETAFLARLEDRAARFPTYLTLDGTRLNEYLPDRLAEMFLYDWNHFKNEPPEPDSALYDMAIAAVDKNTVALRGRITGEAVRIVLDMDGRRSYTSDNPDHMPWTYDPQPRSCPSAFEPEWYFPFLQANAKPNPAPKAKP